MGDYPVNLNDNLENLPQLQQLYEGSRGPDGHAARVTDFAEVARAETAKLGDNPSLTDVAGMVMSSLFECKADIKNVQGVLAKSVGLNTQKVDLHDRQLAWLKQNASNSEVKLEAALRKVEEMENTVKNLKVVKEKHYKNICEARQRSVKGNFILSGPDIPRFIQGENLFSITAQIIWDKYGISLDWYQLRALHRLPSGGIILATATRMPGSMFEHLMRAVNGNPNRHIRAYINIQLMEPFDALHYVARKLKSARMISNYRLDENGYTWVAISEDKNSFKFTSIKQLLSLGVNLPGGLRKDVEDYQGRRAQREKEAEEKNLARGSQPRLNRVLPPSSNTVGGSNLQSNHAETLQNSSNNLGASSQFSNPPEISHSSTRQGALPLTGANATVQGPRPGQPNLNVHGSSHVPNPPPSVSAGGGPHLAQGGSLVGGITPGRSQPSVRPQRSPRTQKNRGFEVLRNQFERRNQHEQRNQYEQRNSNTLFNPYLSEMERRAYNLAEEFGLSPGTAVNNWDLGID